MIKGGFFQNIKRRFGIRFRLACIAAAFVVLAATIATSVTTHRYIEDSMERSSERTEQMLKQLAVNIDGYIEDISNVASYAYYSTDVISALEAENDGSALSLLERQRTVEGYLNRVMLLTKNDILSYYILTDDAIYYGGKMQKNIDYSYSYLDYSWYQAMKSSSKSIFLPTHLECLVVNPQYKVISIVKPLRGLSDTTRLIGVIKVDLNYSAIEEAAQIIDTGTMGGVMIVDQNNEIIYRNMDSNLYDALIENSFVSNGDTVLVGDESYLINEKKLYSSGWRLIAANSMSELSNGAVSAVKASVIVAAASAIVAVVLVFLSIHKYLRPLDELVQVMKLVEAGNLTVNQPIERSDEIGYVVKSFNSMISTVRQSMDENTALIKRVYTAEMLNTEAQLYALQSQIKPHFLYNALNLFIVQIQMGMVDDAVDSICKLEILLRGIMKWQENVTVEESYRVLDSYLSIQKRRFGDRLEYSMDCDTELNCKEILPFILQPIVENAVIHGCESNRGRTVITVKGYESNECTIFSINDTGVGISSEKLNEICESMDDQPVTNMPNTIYVRSHNLGLKNVHQRIKLRYGEQYGLSIESEVGKGTNVTVRLPILGRKDDDV